jgi:hypothetical protein
MLGVVIHAFKNLSYVILGLRSEASPGVSEKITKAKRFGA